MVVLKPPLAEIQGKMGGNIWRVDQCGQHCQASPREINSEPSEPQKIRRRAFSKCRQYMIDTFTQYHAARWQQYANNHPRKTTKGKIYELTWFQQFISTNINRVVAGEEILEFPPD